MTDLTPEVLARWEELARGASMQPWVADRMGMVMGVGHWVARSVSKGDAAFIEMARPAIPALLSGVRSRDARIAEQDEEIATLRQQRSDNLKAIAERDAVIAEATALANSAEWVRDLEAFIIALRAALSAAPSSVLATRDAEKWDEGARWAFEEITGEPENRFGLTPGDNPYRPTE